MLVGGEGHYRSEDGYKYPKHVNEVKRPTFYFCKLPGVGMYILHILPLLLTPGYYYTKLHETRKHLDAMELPYSKSREVVGYTKNDMELPCLHIKT